MPPIFIDTEEVNVWVAGSAEATLLKTNNELLPSPPSQIFVHPAGAAIVADADPAANVHTMYASITSVFAVPAGVFSTTPVPAAGVVAFPATRVMAMYGSLQTYAE